MTLTPDEDYARRAFFMSGDRRSILTLSPRWHRGAASISSVAFILTVLAAYQPERPDPDANWVIAAGLINYALMYTALVVVYWVVGYLLRVRADR